MVGFMCFKPLYMTTGAPLLPLILRHALTNTCFTEFDKFNKMMYHLRLYHVL
jgi:hypothetical protein